MKTISLLRPFAATVAVLVLLAGCGGGGGDDGAPPSTGVPPGGSARYAEVAGEPQSCSVDRQKKFVRAYMDEVYLWYDEIPAVDANAYTTAPDYFNALLVRTPDATGRPKDRFSAAIPTGQAQDMSLLQDGTPANVVKNHDGTNPVPVVRVDSVAGRSVGYIQFTDHSSGAQDHLINAFQQMKNAAVQDLVLDLRANSGGYLYVALAAASMITGPASEGKVFEKLRYNAKRQALSDSSVLKFSGRAQFTERDYAAGTPLPQLSLPRVFVLTTGSTCSASESIINSLRGIDVAVIRVGTTTCGKPYGFTRKDNCGVAYFPIEFQGTNAKGFGDYQGGFQPMCTVTDNAATPAESTSDELLATAHSYIANGQCPAGTENAGVQSAGEPIVERETAGRPFTGRLLLPQQRTER